MFDLMVCGLEEAISLVDSGWPTRVISTVNMSVEFSWDLDQHLIVRMNDIEQDFGPKWITPSIEHVDAVLGFTNGLGETDRLIVHCHQGLSRSTAMAIGICVQHGMDPISAYRHVERIRPVLLPNTLIIALIDDRFGLKGKLTELVLAERRKKMNDHMGGSACITKHGDVVEMKSILEGVRKG